MCTKLFICVCIFVNVNIPFLIIEIELTYNIVVVLGVQHNDICMYCEMITVGLVNIHHHTVKNIFSFYETF